MRSLAATARNLTGAPSLVEVVHFESCMGNHLSRNAVNARAPAPADGPLIASSIDCSLIRLTIDLSLALYTRLGVADVHLRIVSRVSMIS
jgi:hypothetical protein